MNKIDRDALLRKLSEEDNDLQLVVGADDLKSIERDIDDFFANKKMAQMIVTSPGRLLTGAIRFGLGKTCDLFMGLTRNFSRRPRPWHVRIDFFRRPNSDFACGKNASLKNPELTLGFLYIYLCFNFELLYI